MNKVIFSAVIGICFLFCNSSEVLAQCYNNFKKDSASVVSTILARRSIRKYKPEVVRRDQMDIILKCGINAPSGMNKQPWLIRVVDDPAFLNGITKLYIENQKDGRGEKMLKEPGFRNIFRNAPTLIFIASPKDGNGQLDCGLLGENIMLSAQSMGVGSCCLGGVIGFMNSDIAKNFYTKLNIPSDYQLLYAIALGYPDEDPVAKPRDTSKVMWVK